MPERRSPKTLRRQMFGESDRCFVCALPMLLVETPPGGGHAPPLPADAATIEHITELCEGGSWRLSNLALSHFRCNVLRSRHRLFVKRWGEQVTRGRWLMPAWPALEVNNAL